MLPNSTNVPASCASDELASEFRCPVNAASAPKTSFQIWGEHRSSGKRRHSSKCAVSIHSPLLWKTSKKYLDKFRVRAKKTQRAKSWKRVSFLQLTSLDASLRLWPRVPVLVAKLLWRAEGLEKRSFWANLDLGGLLSKNDFEATAGRWNLSYRTPFFISLEGKLGPLLLCSK